MLQIKDLTIQYPCVLAVNNFSFEFEGGKIYGLIGPNGAGKTSVIKAVVGLVSSFAGSIEYDKISITKHRHKFKSIFGYAPEDTTLLPYLTGREYLQLLADIRHIDRPSAAIAGLVKLLSMEDFIDGIVHGYSHGMGKKLALAAALLGDPKIVIFDEALNGLDPVTMFNVRRKLRELADAGHLVILSSHVLEVVEKWCDSILIMHHGRLLVHHHRDKIEEILAERKLEFSAYFMQLIGKESQKQR